MNVLKVFLSKPGLVDHSNTFDVIFICQDGSVEAHQILLLNSSWVNFYQVLIETYSCDLSVLLDIITCKTDRNCRRNCWFLIIPIATKTGLKEYESCW